MVHKDHEALPKGLLAVVVRGSLQVLDLLLRDRRFHLADNHVPAEVLHGSRKGSLLGRVISREVEVVLVEAANVGGGMHMNRIRRDGTRLDSLHLGEGMGEVMICVSSPPNLHEIAFLEIAGARMALHTDQHDHHDVVIWNVGDNRRFVEGCT